MASYYRIGQVAEHVGVSAGTVRNLERQGKIPPAVRTLTGYRVYRPQDIRTIECAVFGNRSSRV